MRDALFILVVIAILLGLTAIKYRRQVVAMIQFYKQVKAVQSKMNQPGVGRSQVNGDRGIQLIKCSRCQKWIPQSEAIGDVSRPVCANGCKLAKPV
jgi:hypothetical protein